MPGATLNEKQVEFTRTIALFITWCFANDYHVIGAELYRSEEQARLNSLPTGSTIRAEVFELLGIPLSTNKKSGISQSVHRYKLALDMFRVVGGKVSWDATHYVALGEKWKSMHPLARWGGDFPNRDCVHFSFEHNGKA